MAIELDPDNNGAIDIALGGTNAQTAAGARANLGLSASVADYTAARALTGLSAGQLVSISYRSALGDGGGGVFYFDASDQSAAVSTDTLSGITLALDSDPTGAAGALVRVNPGPVNVRWFGAAGDGVEDDTDELRAAHAYPHVEYTPGDIYLVNSDIPLQSNSYLYGNGATVLVGPSFSTQSPVYRNDGMDQTGYSGNSNIRISDLVIDLNNTTNGGIGIAHAEGVTISGCTFKNAGGNFHFIDLPAVKDARIINNVFDGSPSSTMLQIDQAATGSLPVISAPAMLVDNTVSTEIYIAGNTFRDGGVGGVHLHKDGHSDITIVGNRFEEMALGIGDDSGYASGSVRVNIGHNTFDTRNISQGHGVIFYGSNTQISVIDNTFFLPATNALGIALLNNDGAQSVVAVSGNTINTCTSSAILVQGVSRAAITGNTINGYGTLAGTRYGISVTNGTAVTISGNVVTSGGAASVANIHLSNIDSATVTGNEVTSGGYGVYVENPTDDTKASDVSISGNTFNVVTKGVYCNKTGTAGENIAISGNVFRDPTDHVIQISNYTYTSIVGNTMREVASGKNGVYCTTSSAMVVSGNIISSTSLGTGVSIAGSGYNVVSSNRIRGAATGIDTSGSINTTISANVITTYTTAISSGTGDVLTGNIQ